MDIVLRISQRIIVMAKGAIIAEGRPEEIKQNEEVRRVYLGE
jgi:ABC-type branched-subunit amino acid transport system ATPase component